MKKLHSLFASLLVSWQLLGYIITTVNLITAQEIEIVCPVKPTNAQDVYANFGVTVNGKPVKYTYLSYFDFGKYANAPVINIHTLKHGLYGIGETVKINSEDAMIAWGCTIFETHRHDPHTGYQNHDVNWVSWATPSTYYITLKTPIH